MRTRLFLYAWPRCLRKTSQAHRQERGTKDSWRSQWHLHSHRPGWPSDTGISGRVRSVMLRYCILMSTRINAGDVHVVDAYVRVRCNSKMGLGSQGGRDEDRNLETRRRGMPSIDVISAKSTALHSRHSRVQNHHHQVFGERIRDIHAESPDYTSPRGPWRCLEALVRHSVS